jgi:membrane-bound serine protease (ClpP class)
MIRFTMGLPAIVAGALLAAGLQSGTATSPPAATPGVALHIEVRGAIGPATSDHVVRGIARAEQRGARLVIIEMDTPGGLDAAMRDINKAILGAAVPVATFVAPKGSRAASAGTYILYASHLAVMSPATNLGAATPVQIGGGGEPAPGPRDEGEDKEAGDGQAADGAMERKAVNDAVAYIRGLAELRGRNADWAEQAVRRAVSLTAEDAAAQGVIDFVAADLSALLAAAHGRTVRLQDRAVALDTAALSVERLETDWRTEFLATITDPNVAYVLLLIGIYGLIFEGYSPGAILPGIVGAICLLLALFAFQVLSVNYAGLALVLLGVALLVAEAFVPSFGALGIGGIIAFVFGSIMLLDTEVPGLEVSRVFIGSVALAGGAALLGLVTLLVRARRRPVVSGRESMIGELAEAVEDFDGEGAVYVHGERWTARARVPVRKGQRLRVSRVSGLAVDVEPVE